MAREEAIVSNATIAAATTNSEQNIRRHRDGVNMRFNREVVFFFKDFI